MQESEGNPGTIQPVMGQSLPAPLRVTMIYDMDACHGPTGVTRHAWHSLNVWRAATMSRYRS